jgi:hypothetical protein
MGGFKGTRPHYIGYRLITDKPNGHRSKEDDCTCFTYTEALLDRQESGETQRRAKLDGEIVVVFAQEGDTITKSISVGFNSRGEIIKPQPSIVAGLRAAGHTVNLDDKSPAVSSGDVMYHAKVPKFTDQESAMSAYSQLILQREMERQDAEREANDEAWEKNRQRMLAESAASISTPAIEGPVKRGPGRPRKEPEVISEPAQ